MSNDQNIENQLKTGLKWRMIGQVASQVTQILTQFLLIYFLSPKEFGLMGQALVFIGFANFFVELGLASSIIREKEVHQTQLSSPLLSVLCCRIARSVQLISFGKICIS